MEHWLTSPSLSSQELVPAVIKQDPIWENGAKTNLPKDRKALFFDLFLRAVNFLILHEWAHHARSHIEFLKNKTGFNIIHEAFSRSKKTGGLLNLKRNIEFDADVHAIDILTELIDEEVGSITPTPGQISDEFYRQALAIICLFQLFDIKHDSIDQQYEESHPPSVHRAMLCVHALATSFAEKYGWSKAQRIDEVDKAWYASSQLAAFNAFPKGRWHGDSNERMGEKRLETEINAYNKFSQELDLWNEQQNLRRASSG